MRSLFRYLLKNYGFFLFISLEVISLFFVFNYNSYQKAKYLNSSGRLVASVYSFYNSSVSYFKLSRVNREMAEENAKLKALLQMTHGPEIILDSLLASVEESGSVYRFISAKVINNSVNRPFNYITLDKGRKDGVKRDQGIISSDGIVGVITDVTESYSVGLSVLNQRWSISARLKTSGFFGSLTWEGHDYRFASLTEIPFHVLLAPGDTVVTSGFSTIFPEGVMIGTIHSFEQPEGENYYNIRVELSTNFKTLSFVDIVENIKKPEIEQIENITREDERDN